MYWSRVVAPIGIPCTLPRMEKNISGAVNGLSVLKARL